ncbi:unnamed protein product [Lathyrus sativus]|nr:unnamed protein product [Lathyrus sativus]
MTAVTTVSYRFNINGKFSDKVVARRGVRQGDPLSPLLFVIIMEYLNRLLFRMQRNLDFNHHVRCERLQLTHLTFADDLLLFSRGDIVSIEIMQRTVNSFLDSTGMKVNPTKSKVYFGSVSDSVKQSILNFTAYDEGSLPFRYLGVPVSSKKLSVVHYLPLMDKLLCRITHWSSRLLSYAGRLQLIKSVLYAITSYWMQCVCFPKTVIRRINAICRTFLWTGGNSSSRKSLIAWDKICKPAAKGGLNVLDLVVWNSMFMMKLLWNISMKTDDLWVRWIHAYYLKNEDVMYRMVKNSDSIIFKTILMQRENIGTMQGDWNEMVQAGRFIGRRMYANLLPATPKVAWSRLILHNRARPRAIYTLWMTCHGKLATKVRLNRFGMVDNNQCVFCPAAETIDHLFFDCATLRKIWVEILHWIGIPHNPGDWTEELNWMLNCFGGKGWKADLVRLALTETVHEVWRYEVWRFRNDTCFNQRNDSRNCTDRIINNIVYRGWSSPKLRPHIALLMVQ